MKMKSSKVDKRIPPSMAGTDMVTVYCDDDSDYDYSDDDDDPQSGESTGTKSAIQDSGTEQSEGADEKTATDPEKQKRTFLIHKAFACFYSPYFDRAFNGGFVERETKSISVKVHHSVFGILAQWLYSQKLPDPKEKLPSTKQLIYLWLLADELLIPSLQNDAITLFYKKVTDSIEAHENEGTIAAVWNKTTPSSPLRKMLISTFALQLDFTNGNRQTYLQDMKDYPTEFLLELSFFLGALAYAALDIAHIDATWENIDIEKFHVPPIKARVKRD